MMKLVKLTLCTLFLMLPVHSFADQMQTEGRLTLSFSDGRHAAIGVDNVNAVLRPVGVRRTKI